MVEPAQSVTAADVAQHYDRLDRYYREIWGDHVHHGYWKTGRETMEDAKRALVDAVIERARLRPGMKVLDVGCGYGALARILAREQRAQAFGVTLSEAQYQYATGNACQEAGMNPAFSCEDWLRNQQPSSSYDAVLAVESTEHMPDKARALAEMSRVTLPGGRIVVAAWLAADHRRPWQDRHLIAPACREGRLAGLGTPAEYVRWIQAAGLDLEETLNLSRQVTRTWPACAWGFVRAVLRRPQHLGLLFDRESSSWRFGLAMLRIWLAYRLGVMRYIVFTAVKPG